MPRRRRGGEVGPFLKWAGGKGSLLDAFAPLFPAEIGRYFEPFLGAGAVFFRLAETGRIEKAWLNDVNQDLILTFRVVKEETEALIKDLRKLKLAHDEERYYAARERYNRGGLGEVERAAHFIYLNKTGYNGLFRVNAKGEFNVPFGRYAAPEVYSETLLREASRRLRRATLEARDFERAVERAAKGDFVYFDPPYDPLTRTANFTSYSSTGFGVRQQERLAHVFCELDRREVKVMLSNHDTPLVRELYRGFPLVTLETWRSINASAARRGDRIPEVVIRNYGSP